MFGFLAFLLLSLALLIPYALSSFMPNLSPVLHYSPSVILAGGFVLLVWSLSSGRPARCFSALVAPLWILYLMSALVYLPALEPFRPVKGFCGVIEAQWSGSDEAGFFGTALPSMVYYLRRPIFQESSPERMLQRFRSEKRVFCVMDQRDYSQFSGTKDLNLYVLERRQRFTVRFGTLLNARYSPGEELFLVSNRPCKESISGGSGPK